MSFIISFFSAVNLVLSVFLLIVILRAIRKFRVSLFYFILGGFIVILVDSVASILSIFVIRNINSYILALYILSEFVLLLIFYTGTMQRR